MIMPQGQNSHQRPSLIHEYGLRDSGLRYIAGVDEAGRGAWAGPVVAAAVILPLDEFNLADRLCDVRDSKIMTPRQRFINFHRIHEIALDVGLGQASSDEVDNLGIIAATRRAMHRALQALSITPQHVLIDHLKLPELEIKQTAITKGDRDVLSISAASIVAKVARDEIMMELDNLYPDYGFSHHKGYGTAYHHKTLQECGPCAVHRKSFAPVAKQFALTSQVK